MWINLPPKRHKLPTLRVFFFFLFTDFQYFWQKLETHVIIYWRLRLDGQFKTSRQPIFISNFWYIWSYIKHAGNFGSTHQREWWVGLDGLIVIVNSKYMVHFKMYQHSKNISLEWMVKINAVYDPISLEEWIKQLYTSLSLTK